jgi:hypothetical protein
VIYGGEWDGDDYRMWIEGWMEEWMHAGPHMELHRRISTRLGWNTLYIHDVVTNKGWSPQEHQIMYHFNPGFPLLDEAARYHFPTQKVLPRTPTAAKNLATWDQFYPPTEGADEFNYYHQTKGNAEGKTCIALLNRGTDPEQPMGLAMRYDVGALPWITQWKMPGTGTYVTGIEPANGLAEGRPRERAEGRIKVLEPGESVRYDFELEVLTSEADFTRVEAEVAEIQGDEPPEMVREPLLDED